MLAVVAGVMAPRLAPREFHKVCRHFCPWPSVAPFFVAYICPIFRLASQARPIEFAIDRNLFAERLAPLASGRSDAGRGGSRRKGRAPGPAAWPALGPGGPRRRPYRFRGPRKRLRHAHTPNWRAFPSPACWGRWPEGPDGVWPAASNRVGLHDRQREPTSERTCFPHPIRPFGAPSPLRGEGGTR